MLENKLKEKGILEQENKSENNDVLKLYDDTERQD